MSNKNAETVKLGVEQFADGLHPQPEDQLGEHSADADAGTQADAAPGVEASDAPVVVQSDPVGADVTTQDADERANPENEKPSSPLRVKSRDDAKFKEGLRHRMKGRLGRGQYVSKPKQEKILNACVDIWENPQREDASAILDWLGSKRHYYAIVDTLPQLLELLGLPLQEPSKNKSPSHSKAVDADQPGNHTRSSRQSNDQSPQAAAPASNTSEEFVTHGEEALPLSNAELRHLKENEGPRSSSGPPPAPGNLVLEFSLDLLDDKAGTESRELHPQTVDDYAEHWQSGGTFPPILVYQDGDRYFLVDGFHRKAGARKAGLSRIPALVRVGNQLEALEASLMSNHTNGERRSVEDKCYAVDKTLKVFPDRSDRRIATMLAVSPTFVGKRRELMPKASTVHVDSSAEPAQKTRVGRDGKRRKMPGPKGCAQAKSTQKPQAEGQSPDETWKQNLRQLKDQAKALIPGVRQFRKLHPDQSKPLKDELEPLLGKLARLLT